MKNVSCLFFILLFVSCFFASGNTENEFHVDENMIFQDINNKHVKLLKTYSFENVAIDINRCNEDKIVLLRREIKDSLDIYYEEIYIFQHEKFIKSHTKKIDPKIYADMRLKTENSLNDLFKKYKNIEQVTLNKKEINKDIIIDHILFYPDYMHTILRILIGKDEEIVTIPYGILEKIFYRNYGVSIIIIAIVTSPGASSFSQEIKLYKLDNVGTGVAH